MKTCLKCGRNCTAVVYTHKEVLTKCNFCACVFETEEQKVINRNFQKLSRQKEKDRVIFSSIFLILVIIYVIMR